MYLFKNEENWLQFRIDGNGRGYEKQSARKNSYAQWPHISLQRKCIASATKSVIIHSKYDKRVFGLNLMGCSFEFITLITCIGFEGLFNGCKHENSAQKYTQTTATKFCGISA